MKIETFDILNIVLILYIIYFLCINNQTISNFTKIKKTQVIKSVDTNNNIQKNIDNEILKNKLLDRDNGVLNKKLAPPEKRHEGHNYVQVEKVMINEHTRGEPENFQIVGLLYKDSVDKKYQLFGRKIYPGSPDWEYFIGGRDSGGLDYKYPLDIKQELYDGSTIVNPIDGENYNVKIYNYNKPRYIPYIT